MFDDGGGKRIRVAGKISGAVGAAATALVAAAALVGCSSHSDSSTVSSAPVADVIHINVAGKTAVSPTAHVVVRDENGHLARVAVTGPRGHRIAGHFDADHRVWTSTPLLHLDTQYYVDAYSGSSDAPLVRSVTFHTLQPKSRLLARISPLTGMTVGVGQPIAVYFTAPVSRRAAVERRFHVHSSAGVTGAWHWYSDSEMHFRPRNYWPAHSHVTLTYDLHGIKAGPGTWGDDGRTIAFGIGASHISKVNADTHQMSVYSDGKLLHTYPVSTGRDTLPTSSGVHVVLAKAADQIMDSATIGIPRDSPDGYYEHVPWSVRITNSGEFVHAAPWSVAEQGHSNVSHGCVNMAPADAEWFFGFTQIGDVVDVTGTSKQLEQGNGFADWNMSWKDWVAGDALH
jgi:lipoprotein-anchoring transpeptidase ErfK/SrfK